VDLAAAVADVVASPVIAPPEVGRATVGGGDVADPVTGPTGDPPFG